MLVGSGNVGACRGVELCLLLCIIVCKITELILNNQEKLKIKIHIFEKSEIKGYRACPSSSISLICLFLLGVFDFTAKVCFLKIDGLIKHVSCCFISLDFWEVYNGIL